MLSRGLRAPEGARPRSCDHTGRELCPSTGGPPGPTEPHRCLPGAGLCYTRRSFSLDIFTAREGTGGIDDSEPRKDKEVILPYWALINPGSQPPLVLTIPHSHICMRNTIVGLFNITAYLLTDVLLFSIKNLVSKPLLITHHIDTCTYYFFCQRNQYCNV